MLSFVPVGLEKFDVFVLFSILQPFRSTLWAETKEPQGKHSVAFLDSAKKFPSLFK